MNFNKDGFIRKIIEEYPKTAKLNMLAQYMLDSTVDYAIKTFKNKKDFTNYLLEIIPTEITQEDVMKFFDK